MSSCSRLWQCSSDIGAVTAAAALRRIQGLERQVPRHRHVALSAVAPEVGDHGGVLGVGENQ